MSVEDWNQSLSCLLEGDYDDHWPHHEWIRTGNPQFKDQYELTPSFNKPVWNGEIEPIILLINADFGMGDTIHFWRFISSVKERVSKVILRCDEDFRTLFQGIEIVGKEEPLPKFDKIIHMMALPYVLNIKKSNISGNVYLEPNSHHPVDSDLESMLNNIKWTKIGICSQGNPFNPRDATRSLKESNDDAFPLPFFNLNKIGVGSSHAIDVKAYMNDWNATAHLIKKMDLIISVDTAIVHLAGSLGIKCFTIIPRDPDWRWGKVDNKTLWYDNMTLIRSFYSWQQLWDDIKVLC